MLPVGLDHNPLVGRHAVLGQEAVEVVQGGAIHRAGHDQQFAAAGHIVGEHIPLLPGDVAGGGVDEEAGGVLRNGVHGQQGEVVQLHVRLLQLILEGGGQLALAVALQPVELGLLGVDHIIDGRGDGALAVKGGVVGVGVHVRLGQIDIVVGNKPAALPALHHQAVVLHRLVGVLLGEGGVDVGVFLDHGNVVGQALVFAQEVFDHRVLLAGLHDPVDGHVLLQRVDHHLGVAGDGVELGGADVVLGQAGGQGAHQKIEDDEQRQHRRRQHQRVGSALKGLAAVPRRAGGCCIRPLLHQLYLLFSKDCTERNRKRAATVR